MFLASLDVIFRLFCVTSTQSNWNKLPELWR